MVSAPKITVQQSPNQDDFILAMEIVLKRMLNSYKAAEPNALFLEVVSARSQELTSFIDTITHSAPGSTDQRLMSIAFTPGAKVNKKPGGLCLLQYDPQRRGELLYGYERSGIFTKRDIVYYLAAHEFGHCMIFHQASLGRHHQVGSKEHEVMADKIAMAFFVVNGQPEVAQKIVRFNETLITDKLHAHAPELRKFYATLSRTIEGQNVPIGSMLDLLTLAQL